jgi:hypothetical protein
MTEMNQSRAEHGALALRAYMAISGMDEEPATAVVDLIADLLHLVRRDDLWGKDEPSADEWLKTSIMHFEAEVDEGDEEEDNTDRLIDEAEEEADQRNERAQFGR